MDGSSSKALREPVCISTLLETFSHCIGFNIRKTNKSNLHQASSVSSLVRQIDDLDSLSNGCCVIHFCGGGVAVFVVLGIGRRLICTVLIKSA